MFNRFLNKIADTGKASPNRSAGSGSDDLGSPDEFQTPEAAEGFLCPACMIGFPSAETLQDHYETSHTTSGSGETHVCSACKMKLATARELEAHFARHHMPPKNNDKSDIEEAELLSNSTLRQELDDLHTSLKEERWYTHELKKEIERLHTSVEFSKGTTNSRTEADMFYQNQIKVLEESKSLALNEVVLLKEHLGDSREELSRLRLEKDKLEQRAATLASDLANVKANLDEVVSEKFDLSQKYKDTQAEIASLQMEVQQRIGAEDAMLLRQELVNVQRAMDELTLAKEVERQQLHLVCQKLEAEKGDMENALSCAPDLAEIDRLKSQISELNKTVKELKDEKMNMHETFEERFEEFHSSSAKELLAEREKTSKLEKHNATIVATLEETKNALKLLKEESSKQIIQLQLESKQNMQEHSQEMSGLRSESDKLQRHLEEKEALVDEMKAKLQRLENQCQENNTLLEKYKDEISEKSSQLDEFHKLLNEKQLKSSIIEADFIKLQEQLGRLEVERTDLYAKIESGDGAKTAIAQLQQENSTLQDQVKKLQDSAIEFQKEMKTKIDDANNQLKQQKEKTSGAEKEVNKAKAGLTQAEEQIKELTGKCRRLENEIEKKETRVANIEASKAADRLEMEKLLLAEQQKIDDNLLKVAEVQSRLDEANKQLSAEQKSSQDYRQRLQKVQAKSVETEKQLTAMREKESSLLNQLSEGKKVLESTKSKKTAAEAKLAKLEEELKKKDISLKESIDLVQKLEENKKVVEVSFEALRAELASVTEALELKENELVNREKFISESSEEIVELKRQMEDDAAEYHKLNDFKIELGGKIKQLETQLEEKDKVIKSASDELENAKKAITMLHESEGKLNREVEEIKSRVIDTAKELAETKTQASDLSKECEKLHDRVSSTENELDSARTMCKSFELRCDNLEDELKDREFRLQQETESLTKAEDARALLIDQKLKLQAELKENMKQVEMEIQKCTKLMEEFGSKEKDMQERVTKLNDEIDNQRKKHKDLQRQWDDARSELEGQVSVMQENLSTLRQDFAAEKDRTVKLETKVDELGGQKLELEAKLENALDERRALLDRCLRSEDECEKLRGSTGDLRRKLDDTLAALHELGRENQSLQIENTKLVQRKWAEDAEVTHCTACRKQFTVTIRKHHCRSCGSIFCNECSLKTATIASYKKAVRVCDSCYEEVGQ